MRVEKTEIPDVVLITPARHGDARGFFSETWSRRALAAHGLEIDFVQDNLSRSAAVGTIRGLHYQRPPHAQGKLVRAVAGRIRDVAVDARQGSPHYGRWVARELTAERGEQLWVPAGFLHGFATLEADTEVAYKVDAYYDRAADGAIRFDDPNLGVDWGVDPAAAVLSEKDGAAPAFRDFDSPFVYEAEG